MTSCTNCQELLMKKLCNIPSAWRSQIAEVLCDANKGLEIKPESLTSLSDWNINYAPEVCISYTDEQGVTVTRCFDFSYLLNQQLNEVDPRCLSTPEVWNGLSYVQKMQLLVDKLCTACFDDSVELPTITTTTTTTIPVSTTPGKVYFGSKSTNTVSQADVAATSEYQVDPALPIVFDWRPYNTAPAFLWFATPFHKTHWQDMSVLLNNGGIGTIDDLFGPAAAITVNGQTLYLYVTMYQTQVDNLIQVV
jgi:hypothetical protein